LLGVSRPAKNFKVLGLEAISSLKFGCFEDRRKVFPRGNTFFQWKHLQSLHVDVMTDNLRDCTLQGVAHDQCPSLRELVLHSSPLHERRTTPAREPFHISDILPKCPRLERLLISRSEVVEQGVFSQLVREGSEAAEKEFVFKGPVLREGTVLVQEFTEESDAVFCLNECRLYRAILSAVYQPSPPKDPTPRRSTRIPDSLIDDMVFDNMDRSASARQVIGETATVQSWCRDFGEGE
jgi:hypothetical protein